MYTQGNTGPLRAFLAEKPPIAPKAVVVISSDHETDGSEVVMSLRCRPLSSGAV